MDYDGFVTASSAFCLLVGYSIHIIHWVVNFLIRAVACHTLVPVASKARNVISAGRAGLARHTF